MVEMNDADAGEYIVKDIAARVEDGLWRWTFDRPELEVWLDRTTNVRMAMEFIIADEAFRNSGPVTVTLFVNEHAALSQKYDAAGRYRMEAAVPASWIDAPGTVRLAAEARPLWAAGQNGQHFGIALIRAGFL